MESERITTSAETTEALAAAFGASCHGGELVVLSGDLGAGKTCFVRGFVRGCGGDSRSVKSPSFTLLHSYGGRRTVHHFDVYFTKSFEDLVRADLLPVLAAGEVALIEWGERFARELPVDRLEIELTHLDPQTRRLRFRGAGARAVRWLETALKAHDSPGAIGS